MARAAIAAGADGLMIEVHHNPDEALSDGAQSLYPKQFGQLTRDLYVIAPVIGKQLDFDFLEKVSTARELNRSKGKGGQQAAFFGEPGTYTHKACAQYFGSSAEAVPMPSFRAIFDAVKEKAVDYGVVPLENSLAGSVHETYDLLLEHDDLRIVGEITLRIIHNLIGMPGTDIENINRVCSIPQVFQQCRQFLSRHDNWEMIPASDTARAVKAVGEAADPTQAAIASREAAEIYGMAVIEEGIETNPRNYTRFVVIGNEPLEKGPNQKSSLIYSTGNQPGALFEVLKIFADNGVNLVKLESRPIHGKPWEYMFYVDIEADVDAEDFKPVLESLKEKTDYFKVLGSYHSRSPNGG
jgi:prephenate dehydratase